MKIVTLLILTVIAGASSYLVEPVIRPFIMDDASSSGKVKAKVDDKKTVEVPKSAAAAVTSVVPDMSATAVDDPFAVFETQPAAEPSAVVEAASPEAAPTSATAELMKSSFISKNFSEIQLEKVSGWRSLPDEEIEGVIYQIGSATHETEEVFGTKKRQFIARIKDGEVVRWIWSDNGLDVQ